MFISRLSYQHFRNFPNLDVNFHQGFVVLTGANGAGKTNFLEGILYGSVLQRFGDSKLSQLFEKGINFFRVKLNFEGEGEKETMEVVCQLEQDKYQTLPKYNNQVISRGSYAGKLPVITFLPQDVGFLARSPRTRRQFLNHVLDLTSAKYRHARAQYERTLRQRNEVWEKIRLKTADMGTLSIWDEKLADFGSQIIALRQEFLTYINNHFGKLIREIFPDLGGHEFIYEYSGDLEKDAFLEKVRNCRPKEQTLFATAIGPQRDDFRVMGEDGSVVGWASRGQLRAITLALKILERDYIRGKLKKNPIMLFDDVFSEFDESHQKRVAEFFKSFDQVFLTTAHLEEVEKFLPKDAQIFSVEKGAILPFPGARLRNGQVGRD